MNELTTVNNSNLAREALQVFSNPEFGNIRGVKINGEAWFVGADVARGLGYRDPFGAVVRHVENDDSLTETLPTNGGPQKTRLINESGLYTLIIMSELPTAKKFKRWVTKEVLPSILKTGSYQAQPTSNQLILQLAQANVALESRIDDIERQAEETTVKVEQIRDMAKDSSRDYWKLETAERLKRISVKTGLPNPRLQGRLYARLEADLNVNLKSRITNLRKRMERQGIKHRERMSKGKLDVVSGDKKLRAGFEKILEEYES